VTDVNEEHDLAFTVAAESKIMRKVKKIPTHLMKGGRFTLR
jgi:hypothetical protein